MAEGLGMWLRRAREAKDLSLDQVEKTLRIRRRYLQALEVADYAALPGPIQARGFLRNYARFLGLPVEEALARYESEISGQPVQPRPRPTVETTVNHHPDRPTVFAPPPDEEEIAAPTTGVSPTLLWVLVGAMIFFALLALGSLIYLELSDRSTVPAPTPSFAPTAVLELTPEVVAPASGPSFMPALDGTVTVRLDPQEHAWIRLVTDGEVAYQGVAGPGERLEVTASERCLVETGNGGAFQLFVNGEDWGALGEGGQIVRRVWSPSGEESLSGLE